jgi:hypothetical protein
MNPIYPNHLAVVAKEDLDLNAEVVKEVVEEASAEVLAPRANWQVVVFAVMKDLLSSY